MDDDMRYFFEVFDALPRGGPGDDACTRRAIDSITGLPDDPEILDIGCGPGMQTLELARAIGGRVTGLDTHQPFLDRLARRAREEGLTNLRTVNKSMFSLDYPDSSFDVVWSEGALYVMGFRAGLDECFRLLRPGGYAAVSEAVRIKDPLSPDAMRFWEEYPALTTIDRNLVIANEAGFQVIDSFTLPRGAWVDNYYGPMQRRIEELRVVHEGNAAAQDALDQLQFEIDVHDRHGDEYSYAFLVLRRPDV